MRALTVHFMALCVLVAPLLLPLPQGGVATAQTFNLEKALREAKTPADHEAIAIHYDHEASAAKAKAAEHHKLMEAYRNLAGKGQFGMEKHCQQLVQNYEHITAANTALATTHRQMAQEAAQKK